MLEQVLIDFLLHVRPGAVLTIVWLGSIVATAVLTRWIVRRRESASKVQELKEELRSARGQAAREARKLARDRDRYMTLAFGKAIERVREGGEEAVDGTRYL